MLKLSSNHTVADIRTTAYFASEYLLGFTVTDTLLIISANWTKSVTVFVYSFTMWCGQHSSLRNIVSLAFWVRKKDRYRDQFWKWGRIKLDKKRDKNLDKHIRKVMDVYSDEVENQKIICWNAEDLLRVKLTSSLEVQNWWIQSSKNQPEQLWSVQSSVRNQWSKHWFWTLAKFGSRGSTHPENAPW